MTKPEYEAYQKAVAAFFEREGLANLSSITDTEGNCESFFSWRPCECCGDPLGGDRERCNGYAPVTKEIKEFTVCMDCVYYAEYGQLDDTTMLAIERSQSLKPYRFSFFSHDVRQVWIRFYRIDMESALEDCKKVALRENPDACAFMIESDQDDLAVRKSWGLDK